MTDLLVFRDSEPQRFSFIDKPVRSNLVHWRRKNNKWTQEPCRVEDCPRCLEAERPQQRFTAEVMHEGVLKHVELPLGPWAQIRNHWVKTGKPLHDLVFEIERTHRGVLADWRVRVVRD